MEGKKTIFFIAAGALAIGIGVGYFAANRGYGNVNIAVQPPSTSSAPVAVRRRPACDGPASINFEDIYEKRSVAYSDARGAEKTTDDSCSDSRKQVNKFYCYENPFGSGNFVPGKVVYDCPLGCSDGACVTFSASSTFGYPYPVVWTEGSTELSLTGISLGRTSVSAGQIYALTLRLKISNGSRVSAETVPLNIRRLTNEEGDFAPPDTPRFVFSDTGGDAINRNATYSDQPVVFKVGETERQFELTTGGASNIFFSVTVSYDGAVSVEKEPTSG